jgi:hypothetical protein
MRKKSILAILLILALVFSLAACGGNGEGDTPGGEEKATLTVVNWKDYGSDDPEFIAAFEEEYNCKIVNQYMSSEEDLLTKLRTSKAGEIDVCLPNSTILTSAINEGLLMEIDTDKLTNYDALFQRFQTQEDTMKDGKLFALPFVWGSTAIAYNTDMITEPPTSMNALFDPQYEGQIAFRDDYNDAVMAAGLLGIASPAHLTSQGFITFPRAFAWGTPTFDAGIIITCVFSALALLPMTFTSIRGMEALLEVKIPKKKMNNTFLIHGLSASLGGIFPTVAFMPYLSSIGIIAMTGVASRTPFVWASILMILFGIFSPMGMLLASIPVSVGCGALVIIFALILGQGLKELQKIEITNRESFIIGISILIGVGAMFLPDTTFSNLPSILAYILPNGLIDGIVVALVLEKLLPKKNPKLPS